MVLKSLSNFLLLSHFFYCVGCMVQSNFHFCVWNSGKFITTSNINVNDVFLGSLLLTLNIFLTLFWCFIIDFKQVNSGWVCVFIDEAKAKINTFIITPFAILTLALSWRRPSSYRNQSFDLLCKSMDWFLYDSGLRHKRAGHS